MNRSFRIAVAVVLLSTLPLQDAPSQQSSVVSAYTYFPFELYDRFVFVGNLKSSALYEVLYDGRPTLMMQSSRWGELRIPLPPGYMRIDVHQYIHSQSSVERWAVYD